MLNKFAQKLKTKGHIKHAQMLEEALEFEGGYRVYDQDGKVVELTDLKDPMEFEQFLDVLYDDLYMSHPEFAEKLEQSKFGMPTEDPSLDPVERKSLHQLYEDLMQKAKS